MRIGVVGAHGFIGANLVAALKTAGHEAVPFTTDRPVTGADGREAARGLDALIWVASSSTPASVGADPASAAAEIDMFKDSLAAIEDCEIRRLILVSSGGTVYGAGAPSSEDDELMPVSEYGRLKAQIERVAREARPDTTILRLANVYGPGQLGKGGQGVLGHWLQAIVDRRQPILYGDPAVARDYIYVADCTAAIIAAVETAESAGTTINVGSGRPTSLAELLAVVEQATGCSVDAAYESGRPFDNSSTWLSIDKARDILGWEPTTSLSDGVKAMWEWTVNR